MGRWVGGILYVDKKGWKSYRGGEDQFVRVKKLYLQPLRGPMTAKRRYNPIVLRLQLLLWSGHDQHAAALILGKTDAWVSNILTTDEAKEIYSHLESQIIDSTRQVQAALQAAAPAVIEEKISLALNAKNETVRNAAGQQILEMAGHSAIRHLEIHRPDEIAESYKDKTEAEIRAEILRGLSEGEDETPVPPATFH